MTLASQYHKNYIATNKNTPTHLSAEKCPLKC